MASKPFAAVAVPGVDQRLEQLRAWLSVALGTTDFALAPASSDASFRRYFRLTHQGHSLIAMDAPPQRESLGQFLYVAELLTALGMNVPRLLQHDAQAGFLLMSDLGTRTYYDELRGGGDVDRLYRDALDALVHLQSQGHCRALQLPLYEATVLQREVALFTDWFCLRHLALPLSAADVESLQSLGAWLAQQASAQPRVLVHRDYHSRNLMVCEPRTFPSNPGILDFQDAVQGPLTYDLVSLLRDCYLEWPRPRVQAWVERFGSALRASAPALAHDVEQLQRWFDLMGVQRHLKAIGIFARLWQRDGRADYLEHIPRTLDYVRSIALQYPELRSLADLLEHRILPAWSAISVAGQGSL